MRKLSSILMVLGILLVFSGCDSLTRDDDRVEPEEVAADVEDLEDKVKELEEKLEAVEKEKEKEVVEVEKVVEAEKIVEVEKVVESYTGPSYISLNSPSDGSTHHDEPVTFSGVVSPDTTKVVVTAEYFGLEDVSTNAASEDVYRLQNFNYGDDTFVYRAKMEWNNLGYGTNHYTFDAYFDDGSKKSASVTVFYVHAGAEMGKPVIYLYPEETMRISVNVEPTDGISVSEPELGDGWNVVATPDSKIFNFGDRGVYPYLFWEGFAAYFETPEDGFLVANVDVDKFFDDKLAVLGLNATEISDFKEFWVPRLADDPYYFVTFIDQADFDRYAPLTVEPAPDSVIRVFFDYKGLDEPVRVVEQQLLTPERDGFTVVEWGGRLY